MPKNVNEIKIQCLKKWSSGLDLDPRLSNFNNSFDKWLCQIPEKNRDMILPLIENMEYYSHEITNSWLKELHIKLMKNDNVTDDNTIYVFIKSKDGASNSSNDYWTEYKLINQINKNICIEDMKALSLKQFSYIDNIVFIDDFSGSGKSFIDELKKERDRYIGKNIYFITINIMKKAMDAIKKFETDNNLNIILLSAFEHNKAFERDLFADNDSAKQELENLSREFKIPDDEILGYKKSEALVAFYNNTPNNTLGFIRYDTDAYKSIFPRRNDPKPSWKCLKKNKDKRKIMNYNVKAKG